MTRISTATARNWQRLHTDPATRLKSRANKTASERLIVASSYLRMPSAVSLLRRVADIGLPLADTIYSLCLAALRGAGLIDRPHVRRFLTDYSSLTDALLEPIKPGLFDVNNDPLGFIYQSITDEGTRNSRGIYYTPPAIVNLMAGSIRLKPGQTILDPCCGSGAFLLRVETDSPEALYGVDNDPLAVIIASTNLLLRYPDREFMPQIFCLDFLTGPRSSQLPPRFDFILTNPPWGSDRSKVYSGIHLEIQSRERASMIIAESLNRLTPGGKAGFVLPVSLLATRTHSDVRKLILQSATLNAIRLPDTRFDGVFTGFFTLELTNSRPDGNQEYRLTTSAGENADIVLTPEETASGTVRTKAVPDVELAIIRKMEAKRSDDLRASRWALGIVTGDNKGKLHDSPSEGMEPIYTGKEVGPFRLSEPRKFIRFNRSEMQQCAPEKTYRSAEKLIYRFISSTLTVAYDAGGALTLNSANIVIPALKTVSAKAAAALLNSSIYRLYYRSICSDIKVLKSALSRLPFPELTREANEVLSGFTTEAIEGGHTDALQSRLDNYVCSLFNLTDEERAYALSQNF